MKLRGQATQSGNVGSSVGSGHGAPLVVVAARREDEVANGKHKCFAVGLGDEAGERLDPVGRGEEVAVQLVTPWCDGCENWATLH